MAAKAQIKAVGDEAGPAPAKRLLGLMLKMRGELRGAKLTKHFEIHRGFDAFSIHLLAGEIELALNEHDVLCEFQVLKWQKSGNTTVLEGRLDICDTLTDEVRSFWAVGEGVDGSDKGVGKALSNARKNAFIQAFNLAIGYDVEDADVAAQAGAITNGTTQPGLYQITHLDGTVESVKLIDLAARWIASLNELINHTAVDEFIGLNAALAQRVDRAYFDILQSSIEARKLVIANVAPTSH